MKNAIDAVDAATTKTTWKTETTDANMFDAANNAVKLGFDGRPTGKVFRKSVCGYQIELTGLAQNNKCVDAIITDTGAPPVALSLTKMDTTVHFSRNQIPYAIGHAKPTIIQNLMDQIYDFSDPLKYALKRAGDWGQVEHCVQYDNVFVTSDKLAALYAYYRGVRFILLKRDDTHFTPVVKTRVSFLRYSYILSR